MAGNNSNTTQSVYKFTGKAFLLSTLTSDPQVLAIADRLGRQSRAIAKAHLAGRHFDYKPILIPQKLRHVFGS